MSSDPLAQAVQAADQYFPGGMTTAEQTLAGDEWSMSQANGGLISGWAGFQLPSGLSPDDLNNVLSQLQGFANASGWKYFPTAGAVMDLVGAGASSWTQQQLWSNLYSRLPSAAQQAMPWLQYGQSQQQYSDQVRSYSESLYSLTGQTFSFSGWDKQQLDFAMQYNLSASAFQQRVQNDPTAQAQFQWLKYGMNYQQFQQYMVTNKTALEQRYGRGNANTANALNDLANPQTAFGSYAPPISSATPKQAPMTDYGLSAQR